VVGQRSGGNTCEMVISRDAGPQRNAANIDTPDAGAYRVWHCVNPIDRISELPFGGSFPLLWGEAMRGVAQYRGGSLFPWCPAAGRWRDIIPCFEETRSSKERV
jgi:hypothetical protein